MIAIIDYGMGNLKSVSNALAQLDCACIITKQKEELINADGWILPGVGAFPDCMENLHASGVIPLLKEECAKGKPLLGICLGMQVLFERSYEGKECAGLGLLQGEIVKMEDPAVKIPHIGWNKLEKQREDALLAGIEEAFVYYVHSYCASGYREEDLIADSTYGSLRIPGAFRKENIMATQFHPEKSGEDGLQILRNFIKMVNTSCV